MDGLGDTATGPAAGAPAPGTDAMLRAMAQAGYDDVQGAHIPLFRAEAIAAALVDRHGRLVTASPAFLALGAEVADAGLVARVAAGLATTTAIVEAPGGETAVVAYALAGRTGGWSLPPQVAEAAAAHPGHVVLLTGHTGGTVRLLEEACHAHGLSGLQTRVALETIRTGKVRDAARACGVTYMTARDSLHEAMRRAGAKRLPAFVQRLTTLAFGILPAENDADLVGNLWGLSRRQATIAGLIADGLARAEVAATLKLSQAVVKKEIEHIFLILQVESAAALARRMVEARALGWLTRATAGDVGYLDHSPQPLRFVPRQAGGRIAISDYGPASGRPLLLAHPSIWSRITPRRLVRALQAAGYRPIAIDRPAFALTEPHPDRLNGQRDCWEVGATDTVEVLDALRIGAADLLALHGGAQYVIALGRLAPERLGRVVLVNPAPDTNSSHRNTGVWGVMKEAYLRQPGLIRFAIAAIAKQFSYEFFVRYFGGTARGSAPDEAAYRDADLTRDMFLAMLPLTPGYYEGVVGEQVAIVNGSRPPVLPGADNWAVLIGRHDTLHDPEEVRDYWRKVLPEARFEMVEEGGRLLSFTHTPRVVAALTDA